MIELSGFGAPSSGYLAMAYLAHLGIAGAIAGMHGCARKVFRITVCLGALNQLP